MLSVRAGDGSERRTVGRGGGSSGHVSTLETLRPGEHGANPRMPGGSIDRGPVQDVDERTLELRELELEPGGQQPRRDAPSGS